MFIKNNRNLSQYISVIFFLFGTLFISTNKVLFVWSIVFFIITYLIQKSFAKALLVALIPLSFITVGQIHSRLAVPALSTDVSTYPNGRRLFFNFSPYYLFLIIGFLYSLVYLVRERIVKNIKIPKEYIFFIAAVFFTLLSSYFTNYFQAFSLLLSFQEVALMQFLIIFYFVLFNIKVEKERKNFVIQMIMLLAISVVFISCITILQFFKRSALQIVVEQRSTLPVFGLGADENPLQFRPFGIYSHANILGNNALGWLLIFSTFLLYLKKSLSRWEKNILSLALCFSLLVIVLTQSRSIYFAVAIYIVLTIPMNLLSIKKIVEAFLLFKNKSKLLFFIVLAVCTMILTDRALYSTFTFSETGGFQIRERLEREAVVLINKNFWFGVGKGMFIPANFESSPKGVSSFFPESVHQGFLLLLSESGFIATSLMIISFCYFFISVIRSKLSFLLKKQIVLSILALLIPMLFQPFNNLISLYIVLIFPVVIYSSKDKLIGINSD